MDIKFKYMMCEFNCKIVIQECIPAAAEMSDIFKKLLWALCTQPTFSVSGPCAADQGVTELGRFRNSATNQQNPDLCESKLT